MKFKPGDKVVVNDDSHNMYDSLKKGSKLTVKDCMDSTHNEPALFFCTFVESHMGLYSYRLKLLNSNKIKKRLGIK